jgi:hypothetical protein
LRQREWDHADGQKQKHVKGTSNKMSFNGGIDLLFHIGGPRDVRAARSEVGGSNPGGCTCGEHPFSEKPKSESRYFLTIF